MINSASSPTSRSSYSSTWNFPLVRRGLQVLVGLLALDSIYSIPNSYQDYDRRCSDDNPGIHGRYSPVPDSDFKSLQSIYSSKYSPLLEVFERQLYHDVDYRFFIHKDDLARANEAAAPYLEAEVFPYASQGCTPSNIVKLTRNKDVMREKEIAYVIDPSFPNPWEFNKKPSNCVNCVTLDEKEEANFCYSSMLARTSTRCSMSGDYCSPTPLTVIHEFNHVKQSGLKFRGKLGEILTALQQHILSDAVFKEIKEIVESQEVDYGRTIYVKGKAFPAGELANRYRTLQREYGSLSAALTSPKSIEYLSGVDFQFLDSIEDVSVFKVVLNHIDILKKEAALKGIDLNKMRNLSREDLMEILKNIEAVKYMQENGVTFQTAEEICTFLAKTSDETETLKYVVETFAVKYEDLSNIPKSVFEHIEAVKYLVGEHEVNPKTLLNLFKGKLVTILTNLESLKYVMDTHKVGFASIADVDQDVLSSIFQKVEIMHYLMGELHLSFEKIVTVDSDILWQMSNNIAAVKYLIKTHNFEFSELANLSVEKASYLLSDVDGVKYLVEKLQDVFSAKPLKSVLKSDEFLTLLKNFEAVEYLLENYKEGFAEKYKWVLPHLGIISYHLPAFKYLMENDVLSLNGFFGQMWDNLPKILANFHAVKYVKETCKIDLSNSDNFDNSNNIDHILENLYWISKNLDFIKHLVQKYNFNLLEASSDLIRNLDTVKRLMESCDVSLEEIISTDYDRGPALYAMGGKNFEFIRFLITDCHISFREIVSIPRKIFTQRVTYIQPFVEYLVKDCKADFREIIATDTDVLHRMYRKWKKSSCEEIWVSKGT